MILTISISCKEHSKGYTNRTLDEYNNMSCPIILVSKAEDESGKYMVTLLDGEGVTHHFNSLSGLANGLGESYNVGDTIKVKDDKYVND